MFFEPVEQFVNLGMIAHGGGDEPDLVGELAHLRRASQELIG
jgi:hypothetical protein